jgi:hypothetical protein
MAMWPIGWTPPRYYDRSQMGWRSGATIKANPLRSGGAKPKGLLPSWEEVAGLSNGGGATMLRPQKGDRDVRCCRHIAKAAAGAKVLRRTTTTTTGFPKTKSMMVVALARPTLLSLIVLREKYRATKKGRTSWEY